jgi:hypothetical protein
MPITAPFKADFDDIEATACCKLVCAAADRVKADAARASRKRFI